jgi:hypothetical protein
MLGIKVMTNAEIDFLLDKLCTEWYPTCKGMGQEAHDNSVIALLELLSALLGTGEFYDL